MKKLFFLMLFVLLSSCVFAGEGSGKVTRIYAHDKNDGSGVIFFAVENHTNAPSDCPGNEWAFDANTDHGKAMYALLLSAAAQKQSVNIKGAGDCKAWGDRERPHWVMVNY